jgi:hypothetical protein
MKAKRVLLVLVLCALALLVFTATANATRADLKATVSGEVTYVPDTVFGQASEWGLWTVSNAAGPAGPLGRITMYAYHETPIGHPDWWIGGIMTFTFADGSKLDCTYSGTAAFAPGDHPSLIKGGPSDFAITGGTGRFLGAHGAGEMSMHLHYPGPIGLTPESPPWKADWTIEASISY